MPRDPDCKVASERLLTAAVALWGEDWAAGVSRVAGMNLRTCQRVRATIRSEGYDEKAPAVLAALRRGLGDVALGLSDVPRLEDAMKRQEPRRALQDIADFMQDEALTAAIEEDGAGPFYGPDLVAVLWEAAETEAELWRLVASVGKHLSDPDDIEAFGELWRAAWSAAGQVNGVLAWERVGKFHVVTCPTPIFEADHADFPQPECDSIVIVPCSDDNDLAEMAALIRREEASLEVVEFALIVNLPRMEPQGVGIIVPDESELPETMRRVRDYTGRKVYGLDTLGLPETAFP